MRCATHSFTEAKTLPWLETVDFALHEAEELALMAGSATIYTDGKEPEFSRELFCSEYHEDSVWKVMTRYPGCV